MTRWARKITSAWMQRKSQRLLRWALFTGGGCLWWGLMRGQLDGWFVPGVILWGVVWLTPLHRGRIPVLTYHSVSARGQWLKMPDLVVPLDSFDRQMQWLKQHGYRTVSLDELYELRRTGKKPGKAVALTFDDGYLDAWVAVAPVLEKYALKGTVFVSTGWIEPDTAPRPQIDTDPPGELRWEGYLNPSEIRRLKQGGVLDVQSHGVSHDRIFSGEKINGFVTGDMSPLGIYLYLNPRDKTSWYRKNCRLPLGYPLFETGEALAAPAFFPNPRLIDRLEKLAGTQSFEREDQATTALRKVVSDFLQSGDGVGHMETWPHTRGRWRDELVTSRGELERISGGSVRHLCWPRSAWHPQSEQLALAAGYHSTTAGRDHNGSRSPRKISRVHIGAVGWQNVDLLRFILEIWVFKGNYWVWPILWIIQKAMRATIQRHGRISV